jgi:hypothetical protein
VHRYCRDAWTSNTEVSRLGLEMQPASHKKSCASGLHQSTIWNLLLIRASVIKRDLHFVRGFCLLSMHTCPLLHRFHDLLCAVLERQILFSWKFLQETITVRRIVNH